MLDREKIDELRKTMGTLPESNPEFKTDFYKGVTGMEVKLIDYSKNPYRSMYVLATSCWGKKIDKWKDTSLEGKYMVVKSVLQKMALPLAYEAPQFTFVCERIPRHSFDQIARARVGVVFSSQGTRDNNHQDCGFYMHDDIYDDPVLREEFANAALQCKNVYKMIVDKGKMNWQSARSILPISNTHAFSFSCNFAALQGMVSKRAKFCEADATCAFGWLLREEVKKQFPLLSKYLFPSCDLKGKCEYTKSYYLSNCFGCLFRPCGRNKVEGEWSDYATINTVCSDREKIANQLKIHIPTAEEIRKELESDDLSDADRRLFLEE
jgi:thymidylate synthase ThyX